MQELDKRIALLRLLIADLGSKKTQLAEMEEQYRVQLSRIIEFVVYREGDPANALSLMSEVQGKLDEVTQTSAHLAMMAEKASTELEVLLLTKRVAEARSQLGQLEERQKELSGRLSHISEHESERLAAESPTLDDIRAINEEVANVSREIHRLHTLITEASERAVRTVQTSPASRGQAEE
jgi:hypothetical protein